MPASKSLINEIKFQGINNNFNYYVIFLQNTTQQMVFRYAISTIVSGTIQQIIRVALGINFLATMNFENLQLHINEKRKVNKSD